MKSFLFLLLPVLAVVGPLAPASGSSLAAAHDHAVLGLVSTVHGIPVPGAHVEISVRTPSGHDWTARTLTDRRGRYAFHRVPVGHGVVHAAHPRLGRGSEEFTLRPDQELVRVHVTLR